MTDAQNGYVAVFDLLTDCLLAAVVLLSWNNSKTV